MPRSSLGQLISFAIEKDEDQRFRRWIWIAVKVGDTVNKIAARRGHPEDVHDIKKENSIRSASAVLLHKPRRKGDRTKIKVPGELRAALSFDVLAGAQPPRIVDGYAKFSTVDRPERVGLTRFDGYNPVAMEVPIRFEAYAITPDRTRLFNPAPHMEPAPASLLFQNRLVDGSEVEKDIQLLERMAGRGNFSGAAVGQPPVIRVSTTDGNGRLVALIPENYQWTPNNPAAPLWRVSNIDWDQDPLRDDDGQRIRQLATVTLTQYTRVALATRSVTVRRRGKGKKK
jgi:hypothetical protein